MPPSKSLEGRAHRIADCCHLTGPGCDLHRYYARFKLGIVCVNPFTAALIHVFALPDPTPPTFRTQQSSRKVRKSYAIKYLKPKPRPLSQLHHGARPDVELQTTVNSRRISEAAISGAQTRQSHTGSVCDSGGNALKSEAVYIRGDRSGFADDGDLLTKPIGASGCQFGAN